MVWVLRICLGLAVLAYAAWVAWPVADLVVQGRGALDAWAALGGARGAPGAAMAGLWSGIVVSYALAGVLGAAGVAWAPGVYFVGFAGDILLRLALLGDRAAPGALDAGARAGEALRPAGLVLDATPLSLGALLAVGLCMLALGVWRGQKGAALTRSWTEAPVWG